MSTGRDTDVDLQMSREVTRNRVTFIWTVVEVPEGVYIKEIRGWSVSPYRSLRDCKQNSR